MESMHKAKIDCETNTIDFILCNKPYGVNAMSEVQKFSLNVLVSDFEKRHYLFSVIVHNHFSISNEVVKNRVDISKVLSEDADVLPDELSRQSSKVTESNESSKALLKSAILTLKSEASFTRSIIKAYENDPFFKRIHEQPNGPLKFVTNFYFEDENFVYQRERFNENCIMIITRLRRLNILANQKISTEWFLCTFGGS